MHFNMMLFITKLCLMYTSSIPFFRTFAVSRVPKTNLFLLAVESTCGKCESSSINDSDLPGIPGRAKENILFYYAKQFGTLFYKIYTVDEIKFASF